MARSTVRNSSGCTTWKWRMLSHAIVIGTGGVANFCAAELQKRGVSVSFIESRADTVGTSEAICRKKGIPYERLIKDALTERLLSVNAKTLVVSASNRYLFPAAVLANPNLSIVNYHGALLPKYPGRNAEAWAIFNQDAEGGITWHKVVEDVDAGELFCQKNVVLTERTTSLSLLRDYAALAQRGFVDIVDGLLSDSQPTYRQNGRREALNYSWMKPNDGILDLSWSGEKISAFLRAMDYGPLCTMGLPVVKLDGVTFNVIRYKIEGNSIPDNESGWDEPMTSYCLRRGKVAAVLDVERKD